MLVVSTNSPRPLKRSSMSSEVQNLSHQRFSFAHATISLILLALGFGVLNLSTQECIHFSLVLHTSPSQNLHLHGNCCVFGEASVKHVLQSFPWYRLAAVSLRSRLTSIS